MLCVKSPKIIKIDEGKTRTILKIIEDAEVKSFSKFIRNWQYCNGLLHDTGQTILHIVSAMEPQVKAYGFVKVLLENEVNPNIRNFEGDTPLILAAEAGHNYVVEILLTNGADPLLSNFKGRNSIDATFLYGHKSLFGYLNDFCNNEMYEMSNENNYTLEFSKIKPLQLLSDEFEISDLSSFYSEHNNIIIESFTTEDYLSCDSSCNQSHLQYDVSAAMSSICTLLSVEEFFYQDLNQGISFLEERHPSVKSIATTTKYLLNLSKTFEKASSLHEGRMCLENFKNANKTFNLRHNDQSVDLFATAQEINSSSKNRCSLINVNNKSDNLKKTFIQTNKIPDLTRDNFLKNATFVNTDDSNEDERPKKCCRKLKFTSEHSIESLSSSTSTKSSSSDVIDNYTISDSVKNMNQETLKGNLKKLGFLSGPILPSTFVTLQRYLMKLRQKHQETEKQYHFVKPSSFSKELNNMINNLESLNTSTYITLELAMSVCFKNPDPTMHWRDGTNKVCFNYLLIDPRISENITFGYNVLSEKENFDLFLSSIFYIGKGSRNRPYSHLYGALQKRGGKQNRKETKINEIWDSGYGVISLHIFQNIIPVEAWTREAAMIASISLQKVCNEIQGSFYGPASMWMNSKKKTLGSFLLYKAFNILLYEGQNQLKPVDIGPMPSFKRLT